MTTEYRLLSSGSERWGGRTCFSEPDHYLHKVRSIKDYDYRNVNLFFFCGIPECKPGCLHSQLDNCRNPESPQPSRLKCHGLKWAVHSALRFGTRYMNGPFGVCHIVPSWAWVSCVSVRLFFFLSFLFSFIVPLLLFCFTELRSETQVTCSRTYWRGVCYLHQ